MPVIDGDVQCLVRTFVVCGESFRLYNCEHCRAQVRICSDCDHGPHGGHAIVDTGAGLRYTVKNCLGEAFDLQLVAVGILTERPMELVSAVHIHGPATITRT